MLHPSLDAGESRSEMTRGAREKESASQALEEPDIAEERANGTGRIETEERRIV